MKRKYLVLRNPGGGQLGFEAAVKSGGAPNIELSVEDADEKEATELRADPDTLGIAADMVVRSIPTPSLSVAEGAAADAVAAAATGDAWGIAAIGADTSPFTGTGVKVAVLDTGCDEGHAAFVGVDFLQKDFTGDGIGDTHGHGTHCAGTIFGRDVGGRRIGIARGVTKAVIGKVLDDLGRGSTVALLDGIRWAVQQKAQVISMSLGLDPMGTWKRFTDEGFEAEAALSETLIAYRESLRIFDTLLANIEALGAQRGTVVVAATGNESKAPDYRIGASLPSAARGILAVGATASDGSVATFSNTHPKVVAPGVGILSAACTAKGGGLTVKSGTSMATPHVAGVAALWWEAHGAGALADDVAASVRSNVVKLPGNNRLVTGAGLVRAPQKPA